MNSPPSLFLEPDLQFRLEAACLQDQLLSQSDYVYSDLYSIPSAYLDSGQSKGVLPYLALYPNIHCTTSEINLAGLPSKSGLEVSVMEPAYVRLVNFAATSSTYSSSSPESIAFFRRLEFAHDEASHIFIQRKRHFLNLIPKMISDEFVLNSIDIRNLEEENGCRILFKNRYEVILKRLYEYYKRDLTGSILQSDFLAGDMEISGRVHPLFNHPYFEALLLQMEAAYLRLVAEIFVSSESTTGSASVGPFGLFSEVSRDRRRTFSALAKLDLGINVLPNPRNVREAVEISDRKEVRRLRELFELWRIALCNGELALEARIRKDIKRANDDMARLKQIERYKESPYWLAVRLIGGHVPVVSSILSFSELALYILERQFESRSCWIRLGSEAQDGAANPSLVISST